MACHGAAAARSGQLREAEVIGAETKSEIIIPWRVFEEPIAEIAFIKDSEAAERSWIGATAASTGTAPIRDVEIKTREAKATSITE